MERVNDFDYNDKRDSATISVKVGNVVGQLSLYYSRYDEEISISIPSELQTLIDAGMEFDFSDIKNDFKELYDRKKEEQRQKEREEAAKRYDDSWVHNVEPIEGVEYEIEPKEDYLDREYYNKDPYFRVHYKDYTVSVKHKNVSRDFGKKMRYSIYHSLTDHKTRNYASPENAINKIVKLADTQEDIDKRKAEEAERREKNREDKLERMENAFGNVEVEKKYRHSRYGDGYYYYQFYVVRGDDKFKISEKGRDGDFSYHLEGFSDLTAEQVRGVLEIVAG